MEDKKKSSEEFIKEHEETLKSLGYIESPIDVAKNAIDHFVFALFLGEALTSGSISPSNLVETLRVHTGGPGLTIEASYKPDQLKGYAHNLVLAAMEISAIAMDTALSVLGPRSPEDLTDLGAARTIVYMIRCAFAHDPFNPKWDCRGPYLGVFRVEKIKVQLDTRGLHGQSVAPAHYGGVEGYWRLLDYCLKHLREGLSRKQP